MQIYSLCLTFPKTQRGQFSTHQKFEVFPSFKLAFHNAEELKLLQHKFMYMHLQLNHTFER